MLDIKCALSFATLATLATFVLRLFTYCSHHSPPSLLVLLSGFSGLPGAAPRASVVVSRQAPGRVTASIAARAELLAQRLVEIGVTLVLSAAPISRHVANIFARHGLWSIGNVEDEHVSTLSLVAAVPCVHDMETVLRSADASGALFPTQIGRCASAVIRHIGGQSMLHLTGITRGDSSYGSNDGDGRGYEGLPGNLPPFPQLGVRQVVIRAPTAGLGRQFCAHFLRVAREVRRWIADRQQLEGTAKQTEGTATRHYPLRARAASASPQCASCQAPLPSSSVKRCSRCKVKHYCSVKCQRIHWKDRHRRECTETCCFWVLPGACAIERMLERALTVRAPASEARGVVASAAKAPAAVMSAAGGNVGKAHRVKHRAIKDARQCFAVGLRNMYETLQRNMGMPVERVGGAGVGGAGAADGEGSLSVRSFVDNGNQGRAVYDDPFQYSIIHGYESRKEILYGSVALVRSLLRVDGIVEIRSCT